MLGAPRRPAGSGARGCRPHTQQPRPVSRPGAQTRTLQGRQMADRQGRARQEASQRLHSRSQCRPLGGTADPGCPQPAHCSRLRLPRNAEGCRAWVSRRLNATWNEPAGASHTGSASNTPSNCNTLCTNRTTSRFPRRFPRFPNQSVPGSTCLLHVPHMHHMVPVHACHATCAVDPAHLCIGLQHASCRPAVKL